MEHLEMVEKIRERADITYEEAKTVLEENNWDLLEALTALEKAGRIASAKDEKKAEEKQAEESRTAGGEEPEKAEKTERKGLREKLRRFFRYCRENDIQAKRKGEIILQVPLIVLFILLLFAWEALVPLMVISLFFGVGYSFSGEDDMEKVNELMNKAEAAAASVKEEFTGEQA